MGQLLRVFISLSDQYKDLAPSSDVCLCPSLPPPSQTNTLKRGEWVRIIKNKDLKCKVYKIG